MEKSTFLQRGEIVKNLLLSLAAITVTCAIRSDAGDPVSVDGTKITSMIRLLSAPAEYNGQTVQVIGYYTHDFEHSALFVSKESAENYDLSSGIWVELPQNTTKGISPIRRGYVIVSGVFRTAQGMGVGHLGMWPGTLEKIGFLGAVKREVSIGDKITKVAIGTCLAVSFVFSAMAFGKARRFLNLEHH